ncbi:MAG: adenosine kinase [Bdellovibrionota bacterium]
MTNHFFFSVEQLNHALDVVFVENALVDLLVRASEEQLSSFGMNKGVMQLVDKEIQQTVLDRLSHIEPEIELGGSASNAARGMAILGAQTSYSSCISQDKFGDMFLSRLNKLGIKNRISFCPQKTPTGTCLVVVTPDNERTLNTYLGACRSYTQNHLPYDDIKSTKLFYSTGYMLDTQNQIDALHAAFDFALLNNVKIAFDVADAFVIMRHGQKNILSLLEKTHLVFANAQETQMLLDCHGAEAAYKLSQLVQIAVVKDGENGSFIAHDGKVTHVPTRKVQVADTTGAGDMYAAGFMFGLCRGFNLEYCGKVATILASDTVTHLGARLSPAVRNEVEELLRDGSKA